MLHSSPRDKKRHIQYVGLSKFLGSLFLSRRTVGYSPQARSYLRQDAKGHLTHRSYNSPRDKKRHIQYMGLSKFLGSLFLSRRTVELLAKGSQLLAVRCQRASCWSLVQFQSRFQSQSYSLSKSQSDRFLI